MKVIKMKIMYLKLKVPTYLYIFDSDIPALSNYMYLGLCTIGIVYECVYSMEVGYYCNT